MEAAPSDLGRRRPAALSIVSSKASLPETGGRKFVLLFWHRITERDIIRFGSATFARRGYEPWHVSCWKAVYSGGKSLTETDEFKNHPDCWTPDTREELKTFLDELTPADFILMTVPMQPETAWIFVELERRRLPYSVLWMGKYPAHFPLRFGNLGEIRRSLRTVSVEIVRALRRGHARAKIALAVGFDYLHLKGPMFYLRGGTYERMFYPHVPKIRRGEIIELGSFDVFWAKHAETFVTPTPNYPYAVFLDDAMGHHPDWAIEGGKPENMGAINSDIRNVLDKIERDTGLRIVVALHPKSNYTQEMFDEVYAGRPSFKFNTAALVRDSSLVLGHASTSLSLAVIFNKPVMFLTNKLIRGSRDGLYLDFLAAWMGQKPVEMEDLRQPDAPKVRIPDIDPASYAEFTSKFIRAPGAYEGPMWDHVIDRFEARARRQAQAGNRQEPTCNVPDPCGR